MDVVSKPCMHVNLKGKRRFIIYFAIHVMPIHLITIRTFLYEFPTVLHLILHLSDMKRDRQNYLVEGF